MSSTPQSTRAFSLSFSNTTPWLLLLISLLLAATIRFVGLVKGPAEFQPVRQFHSALIARYLQYYNDESIPQWKHHVIEETVQPIHEPPFTEWIASLGFLFRGEHDFLYPRILSVIAWLVGGVLVFIILRRVINPYSSWLGASFFLFVPYGINQSLSFQPDSLMLAVGLTGIMLILLYHQERSFNHLIVAGVVSSVAILIKPQIIFLITGVYLALALHHKNFFQLTKDSHSWIFAAVALIPPAIYVIYALIDGGITAQRGLIPGAVFEPGFYLSWMYNLERLVGYPILIFSLAGTLLLRDDALRLALGLWGGYILFGLVFTFHFATHSYYHISVLPAVAVGLAGLSSPFLYELSKEASTIRVSAALMILALSLALALVPVYRSFGQTGVESQQKAFSEIGEITEHSTRVVMLTPHEGFPLMFYGWLDGWLWPTNWHKNVNKFGLKGVASGASQTLVDDYNAVHNRLAGLLNRGADFFVVTHMEDYHKNPALGNYLEEHFPLISQTSDYLIYDLRKESKTNTQ